MPTYDSTAECFFAKVRFTDSCWEWTAAVSKGYGYFSSRGRRVRAHRWIYEFCVGPIPDGLVIDHLCRNRGCVNPDHLEAVTDKTNILRGNGLGAQRARMTHCQRGHPFAGANLGRQQGGRRFCRTCRQTADRIRLQGVS